MSSIFRILVKTCEAADIIFTGKSFHSTQKPNYDVACTIEVHNYTKWDLEKPDILPNWGQVHQLPRKVDDGHKEVFTVSKTGYCFTGTSGVVKWKIDNGRKKELAIAWSVPYSQFLFSNYLSIAVLPKNTLKNLAEHLFGKMHYGDDNWESRDCVIRQQFFWNSDSDPLTCVIDSQKIGIVATMGTGHQTRVVVKVFPLDEDDISKKIREQYKNLKEKAILK